MLDEIFLYIIWLTFYLRITSFKSLIKLEVAYN